MAELTPMMQQYLQIKEQNNDCILFFRLGDFYEMFGEDAILASKELDLTLTTRDRDKTKAPEDKAPMCGIPYHACEPYIARLISKGYKVAICEQTEDPALAKGLVKRDIIRIVTPGTIIESSCLEEGKSNFCCGLYLHQEEAGFCACDISTGKTHATQFSGNGSIEHIVNELGRFNPAEVVVNEEAYTCQEIMSILQGKLQCHVEKLAEGMFVLEGCERKVKGQFGIDVFSQLPRNNPAVVLALGALISYLQDTQKTDLSHIDDLEYYQQGQFMELDLTARRNLELTETIRSKEKKGSLLCVLDKTKTAMGSRMIRSWIERPLISPVEICKRNEAIAALVDNMVGREELMVALSGLADMERLIGRIVYGSAGGRDVVALRGAIEKIPEVKKQLSRFQNPVIEQLNSRMDGLQDVAQEIARTIVEEPPFSIREGELIRQGFHEEVDRLRKILHGGKDVIVDIEQREKERTGIRTLKVGYNKVFGYYLEVSNSFKEQVPEDYIRKQTLVNGERFITQELKELESDILSAADKVSALEYELFQTLREHISAQVVRIQRSAAAVAEIDTLCALASVAVKNNYCQPIVDDSGVIEIHDGRHAVVEQMQKNLLFVPNDTYMGEKEQRVAVITGPNMAGKSTYMRQVALIVLMAQIGSFVPASSAHIGVVDRIFTRIGASDDLSAGQSTFMVEMTEVSDILRHATRKSLLILDEIGRGTSTFDGMSIARAVLEHCADPKRLGAKTLFATHYHELSELEDTLPSTKNFNIAVKAKEKEIVFLRKIVPGGADRSYGVEVAQMAGLPEKVVVRAREILQQLETESGKPHYEAMEEDQISMEAVRESEVVEQLKRCQIDTLSPLEALNLLYDIKKKLQ